MFLEEALRTHLLTNAALNAQVGGRISPGYLPDNATLPALALSRVSSIPEYSHEGNSGAIESRMEISCFAATYAEIKTLSANVKKAMRPLERVPAVIGGVGGVFVSGAFLENETDLYQPSDVDTQSRWHLPMDWMIQAEEDF